MCVLMPRGTLGSQRINILLLGKGERGDLVFCSDRSSRCHNAKCNARVSGTNLSRALIFIFLRQILKLLSQYSLYLYFGGQSMPKILYCIFIYFVRCTINTKVTTSLTMEQAPTGHGSDSNPL